MQLLVAGRTIGCTGDLSFAFVPARAADARTLMPADRGAVTVSWPRRPCTSIHPHASPHNAYGLHSQAFASGHTDLRSAASDDDRRSDEARFSSGAGEGT